MFGQSWPRFYWTQIQKSDTVGAIARAGVDSSGAWVDSLRYWNGVLYMADDSAATRAFVRDYIINNTGTVKGTGTAGTLPIWADVDSLEDSNLTFASGLLKYSQSSTSSIFEIEARGSNLARLTLDGDLSAKPGSILFQQSGTDKLQLYYANGLFVLEAYDGGQSRPLIIDGQAGENTLRVFSTSRVGVGSTSPDKKLEVTGASAGDGISVGEFENPTIELHDSDTTENVDLGYLEFMANTPGNSNTPTYGVISAQIKVNDSGSQRGSLNFYTASALSTREELELDGNAEVAYFKNKSIKVSEVTTANRVTGEEALFQYNSDSLWFEGYDGTDWYGFVNWDKMTTYVEGIVDLPNTEIAYGTGSTISSSSEFTYDESGVILGASDEYVSMSETGTSYTKTESSNTTVSSSYTTNAISLKKINAQASITLQTVRDVASGNGSQINFMSARRTTVTDTAETVNQYLALEEDDEIGDIVFLAPEGDNEDPYDDELAQITVYADQNHAANAMGTRMEFKVNKNNLTTDNRYTFLTADGDQVVTLDGLYVLDNTTTVNRHTGVEGGMSYDTDENKPIFYDGTAYQEPIWESEEESGSTTGSTDVSGNITISHSLGSSPSVVIANAGIGGVPYIITWVSKSSSQVVFRIYKNDGTGAAASTGTFTIDYIFKK